MLVILSSGVVINTKYIVAIEPYDGNVLNSKGNPVKYTVYMVAGPSWLLTEGDNYKIAQQLKEQNDE